MAYRREEMEIKRARKRDREREREERVIQMLRRGEEAWGTGQRESRETDCEGKKPLTP